ncbi:ABC transporter substrate-binding protein [Pleomorphochaeta sp. DL1XJH-081]|jgi:ABC-type glycerol-3-phosphate transport system substrate-binding protein|uniref:ABC transporter substrate-binding protein n=1 Tax=Pleomorphochaeta sp. DL1XJH-081 TaxID=3409690 RepID=UPI003BB526D4
MKTKITLLVVMLILATGFIWAAGAEEKAETPGKEAVTEITWWFGNWNEPRGTELAKKFEQENPGYKVNVEAFVGDGMETKMLVAFRTGAVPDVLAVPNGWTIPFAKQGYLSNMDDYYSRSGFPADDYIQAAVDTATLDGAVYGVPYRMETHGFIYNKDLFRAAGLDPNRPPKDWDELLEYAQKLTDPAKRQYGYAITGGGEKQNTIFLVLPMIWMNGGDVISADGSKSIINEKEAVEAVRRYTDYLNKYKVSPPSTLENDGTGIRRLFEQNVNAMMQQGSYALPNIYDAGIDVGTGLIPAPKGKDPAVIIGGWNYTVPKGVENREAAYKFLDFLTEPENMAFFTDTFPARYSALEAERFQDPILQPFKDMLPFARMQPTLTQWPEIVNVIFTEIQQILLGAKEVQPAMDDAAKKINQLL